MVVYTKDTDLSDVSGAVNVRSLCVIEEKEQNEEGACEIQHAERI
jgi:phage-related baseplate assembly protein